MRSRPERKNKSTKTRPTSCGSSWNRDRERQAVYFILFVLIDRFRSLYCVIGLRFEFGSSGRIVMFSAYFVEWRTQMLKCSHGNRMTAHPLSICLLIGALSTPLLSSQVETLNPD